MDTSNRTKSHIKEAASDLLHEGKKWANEISDDKLTKAEDNFKEYSDTLLKKIHENPLTSVLIAGGVGFLLSKILKK